MKTKTAYRPKSEILAENTPSENKPTVEAAIAPSPEAPAVAVDVRPGAEPQPQSVREHEKQISEADEAAAALKRQIEALRESEALNRHAAQQAARLQQQPPLTREGKLDLWRQQGMPADQIEFLEANPELVDYSDLAAFAANEAAQAGHERGSRQHMEATKQAFDQHFARLQAQAQQTEQPAMQESKFFAPPPPKPLRTPTSQHYSAPVSREIPNGGPRPEFEQDPRRVTLSVDERQIAKSAGITETEYARQKVRMMQAKARGEIV
jgi:hypothetical protein